MFGIDYNPEIQHTAENPHFVNFGFGMRRSWFLGLWTKACPVASAWISH